MGPVLAFVVAFIALALFIICKKYLVKSATEKTHESIRDDLQEKDPYTAIQPLHNFNWSTTPPIKIRPFKPKYHISMALENCPLSELVLMDNTYIDRMRIRRALMDTQPEATKQCNPVCEAPVLEFYDWMIRTYLPTRFPTVYELRTTGPDPGLFNKISQTTIPLRPSSPLTALDLLGEHVDTDFLFLLPSSTSPDGSPIYHLQAFVNCFPAGFSTREKCGQPLATIHAPVPSYASKIEKSMDRFFAKIETGKCVKRVNWSISTNDVLFSEGGNHLYADDQPSAPAVGNALTMEPSAPNLDGEIERQRGEVVIENCRLRSERQTLHRLPETKALVFAFKTYLYKLSDVKEEGLGPELAEAIDGLSKGNAPGMAFYKRGVVWGEKVKEYLNS